MASIDLLSHQIVEGEPGIFPAPVARVLRAIGDFFSPKRSSSQDSSPAGDRQPPPSASEPDEGESP